ncbi:MAG: metallophosphoesterase [Clostridia bacterium]
MQLKPQVRTVSRRRFLSRGMRWFLSLIGFAVAVGTYGGCIERFQLDAKKLTIPLRRLPKAFDGLKIAHFSDLHLGHFFEAADMAPVIQRINEWKPDLICFTGDLVDHSVDSLIAAEPMLAGLQAPLGKFAVLGNHDYRSNEGKIVECLSQAGFRVLLNEHQVLEKEGQTFIVAGTDEVLYGTPDIVTALRGTSPDTCKLLLVHEPDFAEDYPGGLIDLQLSGHSHGGQVRLPFIGHVFTPAYGQKYPDGLKLRKGTEQKVFTTRGIGTTILPIRFLCRPEVALLTLKAE